MKVNTEKENLDVVIKCRIDKKTRDNFNAVCEKKDVNGSELLRGWIYKYIAQNK